MMILENKNLSERCTIVREKKKNDKKEIKK